MQQLTHRETLFCALNSLNPFCAHYAKCLQHLVHHYTFVLYVLFCSLAVLDPHHGHTMDVLSPFIPVLCHSD